MERLSRIAVIVYKELLELLENRQSRMMLIFPPLMQIVVFAWAATMEVRNVDFAVLNEDAGAWSREVINRISGSPTFRSIIYLQGRQEIRPTLDQQKALFVLSFDAEFSRAVARGETPKVQLLLDGRRSNAAQITASYLNTIFQDLHLGQAVQEKNGIGLAVRYWFNPNLEFRWFFLPNLIGMISFILGLVVTGLSVARERERGTFDQLLVSPATPTEIAIAKLLPGGIIGIVHGTLFLLIVRLGFGVPMTGSLALFYLSMLLFTLAASGIGLVVSSFCSTQQQAFLGAFALGIPCILISGTITPISNMPVFLQWISTITPVSHFLVLVQGIFLKGISVEAAGLSALRIALIALVCVAVSIWTFRRKM